jgi:SAM-dependent methyltransferase
MKTFDRFLQQWRVRVARPWIRAEDRVLDVGCADGVLGRTILGVREYVGVDPDAPALPSRPGFRVIRGAFPDCLTDREPFDVITMLAVLEHVPLSAQASLAAECLRRVSPGGLLVITVPDPAVDRILQVLQAIRFIDGMETGQHYGFDPRRTGDLFASAGFEIVLHRRFQLGLNNLFVFRRPLGQCS